MSIRTSTDTDVYVKVPTSDCGMQENNCGTIDFAWRMIPAMKISKPKLPANVRRKVARALLRCDVGTRGGKHHERFQRQRLILIFSTSRVDRGEPRIWRVEDLTAEIRSRKGSELPIPSSQFLL
jgi:hypothetical protein